MTTLEGRIDQWNHGIRAGILAVAASAVLLTPGCIAEPESIDDGEEVGEAKQALISDKYQSLLATMPDLGVPSTPELTYSDGVGKYQNYWNAAHTNSDAYTITYHPAVGAHLIYGSIRAKWRALGSNTSPNGYPTTDEADAGSGAGRYNNFQQGTIIWKAGEFEAYSVYGAIYNKWGSTGWDSGFLGFPLSDEASNPNNTGRFNDFDHGAIYYRWATGQAYLVRSPVLEAWERAGLTQGTYGFPTQDTVSTSDPNRFTQSFQAGALDCSFGSQTSVQSDKVHSRILAGSRSVHLDFDPSLTPDPVLTQDWPMTDLSTQIGIRTAMVVFTGSYTRTFSSQETAHLAAQYITYGQRETEYSNAAGSVSTDFIQVNATLPESEFVGYLPPCSVTADCHGAATCQSGKCVDPSVFYAEFNSYSRVLDALSANLKSPGNYDVIHIVFPWQDMVIGGVDHVRSGVAWTNAVSKISPATTWTTVFEMVPADSDVNNNGTWTLFLHETQHTIEFATESDGVSHLASPDNPFWLLAYPDMTGTSPLTPSPVNYSGIPTTAALWGIVNYSKWKWPALPSHHYGVPQTNAWASFLAYSVPIVPGVPNGHILVQQTIKVH